MNNKNRWSNEDVQLLTKLKLENNSAKVIATHFPSRTYKAILAKLNDLELSSEIKWDYEKDPILIKLINENKSYKKISILLNYSTTTISRRCRQLGIETLFAKKIKLQKDLRKQELKKCFWCNAIKPIAQFKLSNTKKCEYGRACDDCYPTYLLKENKKQTFITRIRKKIHQAKKQMIKRNLTFAITENDVLEMWEKQNHKCYYTGLKMNHEYKHPNCFSIERLDSNLGYTKENCVLIMAWVNLFKKHMYYKDFITLCKQVAQTHSN